jgi:hypothetical protein
MLTGGGRGRMQRAFSATFLCDQVEWIMVANSRSLPWQAKTKGCPLYFLTPTPFQPCVAWPAQPFVRQSNQCVQTYDLGQWFSD